MQGWIAGEFVEDGIGQGTLEMEGRHGPAEPGEDKLYPRFLFGRKSIKGLGAGVGKSRCASHDEKLSDRGLPGQGRAGRGEARGGAGVGSGAAGPARWVLWGAEGTAAPGR